MSTPVYLAGRVKDGVVTLTTSPAAWSQLRALGDGPVDVTVRKYARNRSTQANAYYRGVVLALLSEYTGHTADELHEICKAKFLPKSLALSDANGEVIGNFVIGGSTTKLDVTEFAAYLDAIRSWACGALGCIIPAAEQAA